MIRKMIKPRRRILIDINTQRDLFLADAKACVGNHRRVLANIRRMMAWARIKSVPVISICLENHADMRGENYCVENTPGQKKIGYTLLENRTSLNSGSRLDVPLDIFDKYNQVILHSRSEDPFDEPRIERLLSEIDAQDFYIIGGLAEFAVKGTSLGLLQRGKNVLLVADAVGSLHKDEGKLAIRKAFAKGARLVETRKIAGQSKLRRIGICNCAICSKSNSEENHGEVFGKAVWDTTPNMGTP